MGCRVLDGLNGVCFYDSVTETVFGKVLYDVNEAEEFEKWVGRDLRGLTPNEFETLLDKFREGILNGT